jgi:acyl-CoA dehydrogenase
MPGSLRASVREFITDEIAAGRVAARCDSWLSGWDPDFSRRLATRGWIGMTVPTSYGGAGLGAADRYVVVEELLAAGAPVAAHWIADRQVVPALLRFGTEAQRREFLPAICSGEYFFGIGMSEPDAGSDLAALRTRADRVDGGWRVHGTKLWTSNAHLAHAFVCLVRTTAADPSDRHAGLSQLLVRLTDPGVTIRPVISMSGEHHFNEVVLDGVVVPDELVIGSVGDGWHQVTAELAYERSGPERFLSTVPLLRAAVGLVGQTSMEQSTTADLGALVMRLASLRTMSLAVASALDRGETPTALAAMVKDAGTRFEGDVIEVVRRLTELVPDKVGDPVQQLLAESILHSPGFTLRGGTNEVLRGVIARSLVVCLAFD